MAQYSKGLNMRLSVISQYLPYGVHAGSYEVDENSCWVWNGKLDRGKYPRFPDNYNNYFHIHRFVCEHKYGKILRHQRVEWVCGNTKCINPDHIRLVDKSTVMPMNSKLGEEDIALIKIDKRKAKIIAAEYEVSVSLINKIRCGARHLLVDSAPEPVVEERKVGGSNG